MDIKMTSISVLCVLSVYFTFVEALTELYIGENSGDGTEGSDIEIVCDSLFKRSGKNDEEVRRTIRWLRGGPVVEDLEIVASRDERVSIETEILSETISRDVEAKSTLVIRGVTMEDATNYTCCVRDTPMCDVWRQRQQRQLQLSILPTQTVTGPPSSTDKQPTMATTSQESTINNPHEPSTVSTTFTDDIQEHSVIPKVNEAFRQKRVVYTIAVPCALAVVLIIVVIFIARYRWRSKNVNTPVQTFEA